MKIENVALRYFIVFSAFFFSSVELQAVRGARGGGAARGFGGAGRSFGGTARGMSGAGRSFGGAGRGMGGRIASPGMGSVSRTVSRSGPGVGTRGYTGGISRTTRPSGGSMTGSTGLRRPVGEIAGRGTQRPGAGIKTQSSGGPQRSGAGRNIARPGADDRSGIKKTSDFTRPHKPDHKPDGKRDGFRRPWKRPINIFYGGGYPYYGYYGYPYYYNGYYSGALGVVPAYVPVDTTKVLDQTSAELWCPSECSAIGKNWNGEWYIEGNYAYCGCA